MNLSKNALKTDKNLTISQQQIHNLKMRILFCQQILPQKLISRHIMQPNTLTRREKMVKFI